MAMENATTILSPRSTAGDERHNNSNNNNQDSDDIIKNSEILICGTRIPVDLMANILAYIENDRHSLNNLSITCAGIYQVIQDPKRVTKPWPVTLKRPFFRSSCSNLSADEVVEGSSSSNRSRRGRLINNESSRDDDDGVLIFSNDKSRLAVFKDDQLGGGVLEIWDQSTGFIGKVQCDYPNLMWKPVFSPNNSLLVLESIQCSDYHDDYHGIYGNPGIRICQLPVSRGRKHLPAMKVTQHELFNYFFVNSVTFLDDNTLAFTHFLERGITTCSIISSSTGEITTLSEPQIMIPPSAHVNMDHPNSYQSLTYGKVASYYSDDDDGKKNIIAFVHDSCNSCEVTFYDCYRNVLVTRPIPPNEQMVTDLVFSPDGKLLVVAHKTGGLALFDCSADKIGHQPQLIKKLKNGEGVETTAGGYFDISFSPGSSSSSMIITACILKAVDNNSMTETTNKSHRRITRVLAIDKEEIISDGWDDDSSWRLLLS